MPDSEKIEFSAEDIDDLTEAYREGLEFDEWSQARRKANLTAAQPPAGGGQHNNVDMKKFVTKHRRNRRRH